MCKYFDEVSGVFKDNIEGGVEAVINGTEVSCETTHMTVFATFEADPISEEEAEEETEEKIKNKLDGIDDDAEEEG